MTKSESRMSTVESRYASLSVTEMNLDADALPLGTVVGAPVSEECLIVDERQGLSPSQAVENKLSRLLREAAMPISHLQTRGMLRAR